jgi:Spy/CpxP family protein refolding chaperone
MTRRWALGALALAVLFSLASPSAQESARQPPAGAPTAPTGRPGRRLSRAEVQQRLLLLRVREIARALQLDPDAARKLLDVFMRSGARRQAVFKRLGAARRELGKLTRKKDPDAAALQAQVDLITKSRLELAQLWNEEFQEVRALLTPLQQAKYILAQRRFESMIRKALRQVRTDKK